MMVKPQHNLGLVDVLGIETSIRIPTIRALARISSRGPGSSDMGSQYV